MQRAHEIDASQYSHHRTKSVSSRSRPQLCLQACHFGSLSKATAELGQGLNMGARTFSVIGFQQQLREMKAQQRLLRIALDQLRLEFRRLFQVTRLAQR